MFKIEKGDRHGIEEWIRWYQEWARNPVKKYTKEEDDKIRKKCKVGKYRDWIFSEKEFNKISNSFRDEKIDRNRRTRMLPWVLENHPEDADLPIKDWIDKGYHKEIFGKYSAIDIDKHMKERFSRIEEDDYIELTGL